jgi:pyroglutamyl-peptidase
MRILLTGFEAFGGQKINPSSELIRDLTWLGILDQQIHSCLLPVNYETAWPKLQSAIQNSQPDLVVALGQAGGRAAISLERIAINCMQSREHGDPKPGEKIINDGPDGLFSTLPVQSMLEAGLNSGVPTEISNSAGTYLCNYVMYRLLIHFQSSTTHAGFIHVPYLPEQVSSSKPEASMSLDDMKKALGAMLNAAVVRHGR